jgi:hypothetical protein
MLRDLRKVLGSSMIICRGQRNLGLDKQIRRSILKKKNYLLFKGRKTQKKQLRKRTVRHKKLVKNTPVVLTFSQNNTSF